MGQARNEKDNLDNDDLNEEDEEKVGKNNKEDESIMVNMQESDFHIGKSKNMVMCGNGMRKCLQQF